MKTRHSINMLTILIFVLCSNIFLYAESEGEKLFKSNKPAEAILFLEDEINNGTASAAA